MQFFDNFLTRLSIKPRWLNRTERTHMDILDATWLFCQVIFMMVETPIIGLPLALMLTVLLTECIATRHHLQTICNH